MLLPLYKGGKGDLEVEIEKSTKKEPKKKAAPIQDSLSFLLCMFLHFFTFSPQKANLEVQESLQWTVDR